ncbi:hypothetical protein [Nocardia asiatica]
MSRRPDPFAGAKCRSDEHWQWMREHRGSQWDYRVDNETVADRWIRHRRSKGLCAACPDTARNACRELHDELTGHYNDRVPGIWAGVVYADRDPEKEPATKTLPLYTRQELAA